MKTIKNLWNRLTRKACNCGEGCNCGNNCTCDNCACEAGCCQADQPKSCCSKS